MALERPDQVTISLKVLVESNDNAQELLKTDIERLCEERGWHVQEISSEETRYKESPNQRLKAKGKPGRPSVVDAVDTEQVARWRAEGRSWSEIATLHGPVQSTSGRMVTPSIGTIRRAYHRLFDRIHGEPSTGRLL